MGSGWLQPTDPSIGCKLCRTGRMGPWVPYLGTAQSSTQRRKRLLLQSHTTQPLPESPTPALLERVCHRFRLGIDICHLCKSNLSKTKPWGLEGQVKRVYAGYVHRIRPSISVLDSSLHGTRSKCPSSKQYSFPPEELSSTELGHQNLGG